MTGSNENMKNIYQSFLIKPIWIKWEESSIALNINEDNKHSLYQAYGDSPIYGREKLLYIGKTKRDLTIRINEHLKFDFERISNIKIYRGSIDKECVDVNHDMEKLLLLSEALLITMTKPSYNIANIKDTNLLLKNENKYILLNAGNRLDLPLEISNIWW